MVVGLIEALPEIKAASPEEIQTLGKVAEELAANHTNPEMKENLSNLLQHMGLKEEV